MRVKRELSHVSEAVGLSVVFAAQMLSHEGFRSLEFCRRQLERRVGLHD